MGFNVKHRIMGVLVILAIIALVVPFVLDKPLSTSARIALRELPPAPVPSHDVQTSISEYHA